jgi:hypothetical protein
MTKEERETFLEQLCNNARRSWEKFQAGAIDSASVDVLLMGNDPDREEVLARAKERWPGVAFHVRQQPSLREMAAMDGAANVLVAVRRHVERFPVAVNARSRVDRNEIILGNFGWEAWYAELRELLGLK